MDSLLSHLAWFWQPMVFTWSMTQQELGEAGCPGYVEGGVLPDSIPGDGGGGGLDQQQNLYAIDSAGRGGPADM